MVEEVTADWGNYRLFTGLTEDCHLGELGNKSIWETHSAALPKLQI